MSLPHVHPLTASLAAERRTGARKACADEASGRYGLVARFGDEVMREGFTAVPNQVLNHYTRLGITGAEMLFIVHVWQFWWAEGEFPRPSPSTLAEQMGVDERTIRNYTASLEAKGYLTIRQHWGQSERAPTNVYDFSALLNAVARVARGDVSFRLAIDPRPGPATGRGRRKNVSAQRRKRASGPRWKDVSVNEDVVSDQDLGEDHSKSRQAFTLDRFAGGPAHLPERAAGRVPVTATSAALPGTRSVSESGRGTDEATPTPAHDPPQLPEGHGDMAVGGSTEHNGAVVVVAGGPAGSAREARDSDPARQLLHRYTEVLRAEFNDQAPFRATHSRLVNDFHRAGLPLEEFAARLDTARQLTKERTAAIRKRVVQPATTTGMARKNKTPYFFAVFEALLGLRESPPVPAHRVAKDDAQDEHRPSLLARRGSLPPPRPWPARPDNAPRGQQQVAGQPGRLTALPGDADEGALVVKEAVREFSRRFTDWAAADALGDWAAIRWRASGLSCQAFLALAKEAAAAMLQDATTCPSAPNYQVRLSDALARLPAGAHGQTTQHPGSAQQTAGPLAPLARRMRAV